MCSIQRCGALPFLHVCADILRRGDVIHSNHSSCKPYLSLASAHSRFCYRLTRFAPFASRTTPPLLGDSSPLLMGQDAMETTSDDGIEIVVSVDSTLAEGVQVGTLLHVPLSTLRCVLRDSSGSKRAVLLDIGSAHIALGCACQLTSRCLEEVGAEADGAWASAPRLLQSRLDAATGNDDSVMLSMPSLQPIRTEESAGVDPSFPSLSLIPSWSRLRLYDDSACFSALVGEIFVDTSVTQCYHRSTAVASLLLSDAAGQLLEMRIIVSALGTADSACGAAMLSQLHQLQTALSQNTPVVCSFSVVAVRPFCTAHSGWCRVLHSDGLLGSRVGRGAYTLFALNPASRLEVCSGTDLAARARSCKACRIPRLPSHSLAQLRSRSTRPTASRAGVSQSAVTIFAKVLGVDYWPEPAEGRLTNSLVQVCLYVIDESIAHLSALKVDVRSRRLAAQLYRMIVRSALVGECFALVNCTLCTTGTSLVADEWSLIERLLSDSSSSVRSSGESESVCVVPDAQLQQLRTACSSSSLVRACQALFDTRSRPSRCRPYM